MATPNSYENTSNTYVSGTKQMQHEQITQRESHQFELQCKDKDHQHEKDILEKELGWIGRFFGSSENASKNITAIICILLIVGVSTISCIVYFYKEDISFISKMWNSILPIITLSLGYLFGKNN